MRFSCPSSRIMAGCRWRKGRRTWSPVRSKQTGRTCPLASSSVKANAAENKKVRVGTEWQRFSMTFKPSEDFAWMGVGPDLKNADLDAATLWIDAVQFEKADAAADYEPRTDIESHIETAVTGNTFCEPAKGLSVQLAACNSTSQ